MNNKSVRQQFADTMLAVGREDEKLMVLVGDISHFVLQPYAEACPGRYYNVGICEQTILSMAAGLSKVGFYPVVHTIAPFIIERGFEQIKLDFCYQRLGGNLITVGSAFDYSNLGCTHHCYGDFALLKTLQGTQIIYPSSPLEFDVLFRAAYKNESLTLFRLPGRTHGHDIRREDIRIGKGLKMSGGDNLTIVVTGPHLDTVLGAHKDLIGEGWHPEIIYIHTIKPLDTELIRSSVAKTKRVMVVEEHMQSGGLGDDVLRVVKDIAGFQYESLSIPDAFITSYGMYEDHCHTLGLTEDGILCRVKKFFQNS